MDGISRLLDIVETLRGESGCPWDREQTLESLKQCLIEESYEVIDAIDDEDVQRHREELGDVLLQVVMQSEIRREQGRFTFDDVAGAVADKLVRRHPHVFGDVKVKDAKGVLRNWEAIKSAEKREGGVSIFEGVPRRLPALRKAQRVQSKASRVGFDWEDVRDASAKVDEELGELKGAVGAGAADRVREEMGDLFFALVNLCRFLDVDAEDALDGTIRKFVARFSEVERRIRAEGRELAECSLEEMDAHWEAVKTEARGQQSD
jgi:tetrapyrrole methylase family protein/MazG family protein